MEQQHFINIAYLVAGILFILGLKGLTHPRTAVRGNLLGAIAMLIAFYRGSLFDRVSTIVFVAGMSISYLVYIIAFQYLLAFQFDWFPINGYATGVDSVQYLLLPWIIILVVAAGPPSCEPADDELPR